MKIMISLTSIALHTYPDCSVTLHPHLLYDTLPIARIDNCIPHMKTGMEKNLLLFVHAELHSTETLTHCGRGLSLGNRRIIRALCFTTIEHVKLVERTHKQNINRAPAVVHHSYSRSMRVFPIQGTDFCATGVRFGN